MANCVKMVGIQWFNLPEQNRFILLERYSVLVYCPGFFDPNAYLMITVIKHAVRRYESKLLAEKKISPMELGQQNFCMKLCRSAKLNHPCSDKLSHLAL